MTSRILLARRQLIPRPRNGQTPREYRPDGLRQLLENLQGHVLEDHNKKYCGIELLQFASGRIEQVRAFIQSKVAPDVRKSSALHMLVNPAPKVIVFCVTARGRRKLGWPADDAATDFESGMTRRSRSHWPPGVTPKQWEVEPGVKDIGTPDKGVDALLLCAADSEKLVNQTLDDLVNCDSAGLMRDKPEDKSRIVGTKPDELGAAGQTSTNGPFGFRDGISQPRFVAAARVKPKKRDKASQERANELTRAKEEEFARSREPLDTILVPQPGRPGEYGSYLVFQNYRLHSNPTPPQELPDEKAIGRTTAGTPLADRTKDGPWTQNDFDYKEDEQGHKCPFDAHIRKVNPRTGEPRITRRGVRYVHKGQEGLLFLCWQASIANQFERLLGWALNPLKGGRDKLLDPNSEHVTLVGGEYFFAPSIAQLEHPDALAHDQKPDVPDRPRKNMPF